MTASAAVDGDLAGLQEAVLVAASSGSVLHSSSQPLIGRPRGLAAAASSVVLADDPDEGGHPHDRGGRIAGAVAQLEVGPDRTGRARSPFEGSPAAQGLKASWPSPSNALVRNQSAPSL